MRVDLGCLALSRHLACLQGSGGHPEKEPCHGTHNSDGNPCRASNARKDVLLLGRYSGATMSAGASPGKRREMDVMKLMMSDWKVELVNDNISEFNVLFKGPLDSAPRHLVVARCQMINARRQTAPTSSGQGVPADARSGPLRQANTALHAKPSTKCAGRAAAVPQSTAFGC